MQSLCKSAPLWLLAAVALVGCSNRSGTGGAECREDLDCPSAAPFCVEASCVECKADTDCACSAICEAGLCQPLGAHLAPDLATAGNAHGTWQGTPGTSNYVFLGTCESHADCPVIGQLCNPFTKGCVNAADFGDDARCTTNADCAAGTACATELNEPLCLPTPLCRTDGNCCGLSDFVCDAPPGELGLCIAGAGECTPPAEVQSSCPFFPKERGGDCGGAPCCDAGLFCASFGQCVECLCDLDCNTGGGGGQKCYRKEHRCRPASYCVVNDDCPAGEACDLPNTTCRPACTPATEDVVCQADEFCSAQYNVCRPLTERPCEPDVYEPNNTLQSAAPLSAPAMNESRTVNELSLCSADEDWYAVDLNAGEQLLVKGTGLGGAQGELRAVGPDQLTPIGAPGFFGTFPALLEFTAHVTGTYYIQATPSGGNHGFYSLTLTRTTAPACHDPFEASEGFNDTSASATVLFDPHATTVPTGCDLLTAGAVQILTCEQGLALCNDDVDYFILHATNGSDLSARLYGFAGDLDLSLYGPFDSTEIPTTERLLAESTGPNATELVSTVARPDSTYLLRVYTPSASSSDYRLEVEMKAPTALCPEDVYDDPVLAGIGDPQPATLVEDPPGYNDRVENATAVALVQGTTVVLDSTPLTLCRADADWFVLGREDGGAVVPLGAQQRVELEVELAPGSPPGELTVAAGTSDVPLSTHQVGATLLPHGSLDPLQPVQRVSVPVRSGELVYVKVSGSPLNAGHVSYHLRAQWLQPPACDQDTLGDLGADPSLRNDAPAQATLLDPGSGWPGSAGESRVYGEAAGESLTLCPQNDDWYKVFVPAGHQLVASVSYDPTVANVAMALYDSSVAQITTPTAGQLPGSPLDRADSLDAFRQRVSVVSPTDATYYLAVSNLTGWPLLDYRLAIHLLAQACFEDAYEQPVNNNTWERATPFPLVALQGDPTREVGALDPLAMCSAVGDEQDFYAVPLQPGDQLEAALYFNPGQGQLVFNLHGPGPAGLNSTLDTDTASSDGTLQLSYVAASNDPVGNYLLRVLPSGNPRNYYYIEATVQRGCHDDPREPPPPGELFTFETWQPSLTPYGQVLCYDEDWLAVQVPAGSETFTVCTAYNASQADLLLEVYGDIDVSNPALPVGQDLIARSDARGDAQRVVVTRGPTDPDADYFIRVYPTYTPKPDPFVPPHPFQGPYQLWLADGVVDCPPQLCQTTADCSGRGECDPTANGGLGACSCDVGFTGAVCDACAPGYYGPSCLPCGDCGAGANCEDGKEGRGCVAFNGQACSVDDECLSGRCAQDWDGTSRYCAAQSSACVFFDGANVKERPEGWVECGDTSAYQVCTAGEWLPGVTCDATTCDPGGEDVGCGFVDAAGNGCVSGQGLGSGGGCMAEDLGTAACTDCDGYVATASGCSDTPPALAQCSLACGAACDVSAPTWATGVFYCDGDLRREQVDVCADTCTYVDDGAANDVLSRDCAAECGGTCDPDTNDCDCP